MPVGEFVGRQHDSWLLGITVNLQNRGAVRQEVSHLLLSLRYMNESDVVGRGGDENARQVVFPQVAHWGDMLRKDERLLVDPGVALAYKYVAPIPVGATFVQVWGRFTYEGRGPREYDETFALLKVPSNA
jgi:hypothetical protein